jgi:hypothetical protein
MSIDVKVYDNGEHTALVWLPANLNPIKGCRGFTIRRVAQGSPDGRRAGDAPQFLTKRQ